MNANTLNTWNTIQHELLTFVWKKIRDKAASEDIVQDVFIKVQTHWNELKDSEKITGWIFQITRNTVADYYRKNAKSLKSIPLDWEGEQSNFNDCVAQCLNQLLETLPDKYRIPLQLADVENLSQQEISRRLNISYSGTRSRVQRGRKILKEKMQSLYNMQVDAYGNIIVCENKIPCCCSGQNASFQEGLRHT
jgi:RNA polymerase sigma-70 factor (ECF subfamily)